MGIRGWCEIASLLAGPISVGANSVATQNSSSVATAGLLFLITGNHIQIAFADIHIYTGALELNLIFFCIGII